MVTAPVSARVPHRAGNIATSHDRTSNLFAQVGNVAFGQLTASVGIAGCKL